MMNGAPLRIALRYHHFARVLEGLGPARFTWWPNHAGQAGRVACPWCSNQRCTVWNDTLEAPRYVCPGCSRRGLLPELVAAMRSTWNQLRTGKRQVRAVA